MPGGIAPALDRVSMRFPARSTTAVVGQSGAGKSTLADVLTGLLAPDAGEMSVDGVRRRGRAPPGLAPPGGLRAAGRLPVPRQHPQQPALGAARCQRRTTLRQALERAAASFVFRLPQGMETVVGDAGVRLSGGERQRLALARALLKRPSLLILDEATSALDLENEARICEAIEGLHGDLTVVVIGHRLPNLRRADQVVVLEAGRIAVQEPWKEVRPAVAFPP